MEGLSCSHETVKLEAVEQDLSMRGSDPDYGLFSTGAGTRQLGCIGTRGCPANIACGHCGMSSMGNCRNTSKSKQHPAGLVCIATATIQTC